MCERKFKVVNILSVNLNAIYVGTYDECVSIRNKKGFGYCVAPI